MAFNRADPAAAGAGRTSGRAFVRYAGAWLLTGAVTAIALIAALRGCDDAALPPLRTAALGDAARAGRCVVVRADDRRPGNPVAVGRAAGLPARPGVYDRSPSAAGLLAAVRRGVVVIQYRRPIDGAALDQLRLIQAVVPRATIVTPNATRMPYALAAVAWRRLIGCPNPSPAALEALRLFRARHLGRGPDAGR